MSQIARNSQFWEEKSEQWDLNSEFQEKSPDYEFLTIARNYKFWEEKSELL